MRLFFNKCFSLGIVGLILQGGYETSRNVRILGVLQRLALCYFLTAMIVFLFDANENELHLSDESNGKNAGSVLPFILLT